MSVRIGLYVFSVGDGAAVAGYRSAAQHFEIAARLTEAGDAAAAAVEVRHALCHAQRAIERAAWVAGQEAANWTSSSGDGTAMRPRRPPKDTRAIQEKTGGGGAAPASSTDSAAAE